MNKYDDISNYLSSEPNIKNDFDYLTGYITVFSYKNINREKLEDFYNKIPTVFDRIFGISAKTRSTKQISRSLVDLLNNEKISFEEFDTLLHLLFPGLEFTNIGNNFKNLFQIINTPTELVPDYKIPVSIISKSIYTITNEKKQEFLFSFLEIFKILSASFECQIQELEKGVLRLSLFEYFIALLLIAIKENSLSSDNTFTPYITLAKHKINLSKINKNFADLKKNTKIKRPLSEKTKENLFSIDVDKSLVYNFYLILFKSYLTYFSRSRYTNDQRKLKLIVSAMEMIWLSDYFIIPSCIAKNNIETYTFFFRQESLISFTPPNIILLDCLHNILITLQNGEYLFKEHYQSSSKLYYLDKDALLFTIQKPLFYFFKTSFLRYSEISSTNSEINLSDIAKIWFCYITPWMQLDSNQIYTIQNGGTHYNSQNPSYLKGNILDEVIREFIYMNLLFYTELLNDYIYAFTLLNVLNKNELSLLNKVLDLYKIREGDIINDFLNLRLLDDLSQGKIYNYSSLIEVDHHVKYIGSFKRNLFPFNSPENKKFARNIVNNISNWIFKLQSKEEIFNDEIANLVNTLKESQNILKILYNIHDDYKEALEQSSQKNFLQDPSNIYFKRNFNAMLEGNPWQRRLSNEENYVLYYLFFYISYAIDYARGIRKKYDRKGNIELPMTNLRFLSNYYNLGSAIIFILVIYFLIKIIIRLII